MIRTVVVGREADLVVPGHNAFIGRTARLLDGLDGADFDLSYVALQMPGNSPKLRPDVDVRVVERIRVPELAGSRAARARAVLERRQTLAAWEIRLGEVTAHYDVGIALGPWLTHQYRAMFSAVNTLLFADEDVERMPDNAPQSWLATRFREVQRWSERSNVGQPKIVIVVSQGEMEGFRRRFPNAKVQLLPYVIDVQTWPLQSSVSSGESVVVAGNLSEARHADSLSTILQELCTRNSDLRLRLISANGFHECLTPWLDTKWVEMVSAGSNISSFYRNARIALVPSDRATGIKTTILQAWSQGTPVVAHAASAATVGADRSDAIRTAASPAEIVDAMTSLYDDALERARQAKAGFAYISPHLDYPGNEMEFQEALLSLRHLT